MEAVDTLIDALRTADIEARPTLKEKLIALAKAEDGSIVREHLETMKRGELLEIQWEIDDVLDESAPPKKDPIEPQGNSEADATPDTPEETEDPNAPMTAADLNLVYDDPRGFMLHKSKVGERWFATQVDPGTGLPQTFELHANEIEQLKAQLQGSPYWRLGN